MKLLKTRVYPVNVDTGEVYIGKCCDQREGFPTERDCFEQWHGTSVVGFYGRQLEQRMLSRRPLKLIARSIYPS